MLHHETRMSSWTPQACGARELWGSAASQSDSIYVHLWDDHLVKQSDLSDPHRRRRQLSRGTVLLAWLEFCADHIAPTTFMKMPWLLKLMLVRSSEKFVKLYPSPAFTCLPRWR